MMLESCWRCRLEEARHRLNIAEPAIYNAIPQGCERPVAPTQGQGNPDRARARQRTSGGGLAAYIPAIFEFAYGIRTRN